MYIYVFLKILVTQNFSYFPQNFSYIQNFSYFPQNFSYFYILRRSIFGFSANFKSLVNFY